MLDFLQGAWPIPDDIREKLTLALAEEYTFEPQGRSRLSKCDAPQEEGPTVLLFSGASEKLLSWVGC